MQAEIEAKFLNQDHDEIRKRLDSLGAELIHPMRVMRRVVIDYPDRRMQADSDSWVRIRDEGDKVTLTFKRTTENVFGGTDEIEVVVSDYVKTIEIFQAMGLVIHTNQETKRETWRYKQVEVVLDEWPWLDPFIEVEALSEDSVKQVAIELGLDWAEALFGSVTTVYRRQYPHITDDKLISAIPEFTFGSQKPALFEAGT